MLDRTALVTGGARGIGAAVVRAICRAGGRVVFSYRSAEAAAKSLVRENGPDVCVAAAIDHADPGAGDRLVELAASRFGRVDVAVVNHGIWDAGDVPVEQMTDAQWRHTMRVNLDSVFEATRAIVRQMKAQPVSSARSAATRGAIVLVSSSSGQEGEPFHADYAASKGALISFTKSLAGELGPHGIRINCVAPGWVDTDLAAAAMRDPSRRETILGAQPLRRIPGPDDIAGPILFLCSEQAAFVHGEVLNVNGGSCLAG